MECRRRRQTRSEAYPEGAPRSAQAGPILPIADGLREVREPVGALPLPRRQPGQGDAGAKATDSYSILGDLDKSVRRLRIRDDKAQQQAAQGGRGTSYERNGRPGPTALVRLGILECPLCSFVPSTGPNTSWSASTAMFNGDCESDYRRDLNVSAGPRKIQRRFGIGKRLVFSSSRCTCAA
jgi:hypothetical protein